MSISHGHGLIVKNDVNVLHTTCKTLESELLKNLLCIVKILSLQASPSQFIHTIAMQKKGIPRI